MPVFLLSKIKAIICLSLLHASNRYGLPTRSFKLTSSLQRCSTGALTCKQNPRADASTERIPKKHGALADTHPKFDGRAGETQKDGKMKTHLAYSSEAKLLWQEESLAFAYD